MSQRTSGTVICNTSPLVLLGKIGRLELLSQLYETIVVPYSVMVELEAKAGEVDVQVQRRGRMPGNVCRGVKERLELTSGGGVN